MEGSDQAPHDIENPCIPLVTSMSEELDGLSPLSSLCCIYRVPERLPRVSEKACTPQVVSIGPLHHGEEGLKAMEDHKKMYLQEYIHRTRVSSDELVRIILVDAAFIIEVLLRYHFDELQDENDRIFNKPWMLQDVWPDMWLLENQLPFFILEEIFYPEKTKVSSNNNNIERLSMLNLCHNFFKTLMHIEGTDGNMEKLCASKVEHFVDFCRSLYLPLPLKPPAKGRLETLNTPSITELHRAGVKFKVGSPKNLFDIQLANGILEIPN
ncbi:hypothetical protein L3X38_007856 [Prunus dulcis]|uniref:Uncharacterized protein n=1 Tax=Prunus dulcis TaxID=3755 RepID=A0AAD5F6A9_PRUDU|nr:hypothetical protein L3X38_007856 [Prunus dulcis]